MPADASGLEINVHRSDAYSWAMVSRAPDPRLRPYVIDYIGYRELAAGPMRRLQAPFDGIPMIVTFGPSIDIINGDRPAERGLFCSFLAGLHDVHVFTEYEGEQRGMQINFTLLGAYRFLNITMSDIANRCLDLGDLLGGPEVDRFADALQDADDWPARFDLVDGFLLERLGRGRPMSPDIAWALKQLQESHGARSIGALSRDLSCSRKTLIQRFHAQIGLSPKSVASILRFAHAVERIKAANEESWADLAVACGYYDQAHFNRDFRRYSGRTPREFQAAMLPDGGGVTG
ncbi:MAG TPA: AraC family transcriptional regulator [Dongiaceae bacterium]|jgi:AraC-like DNA-binding protein|nr:AraC family transcriptional regulator [Dongiaceae bacterium]